MNRYAGARRLDRGALPGSCRSCGGPIARGSARFDAEALDEWLHRGTMAERDRTGRPGPASIYQDRIGRLVRDCDLRRFEAVMGLEFGTLDRLARERCSTGL
jgi:hypothetical protein